MSIKPILLGSQPILVKIIGTFMILYDIVLGIMATATLTLNEILNRLMFEKRIKAIDLARETNLPQSTVQRMVSGVTPKPHASTLKPIAEYFDVTIEQLKGLQPIPWIAPQSPKEEGWSSIPFLTWEQAAIWDGNTDIKENESIYTDAKTSSRSFALKVKDSSMEPQFPKETIIIIDPLKEPKDRTFIVAKLASHNELVFRQLLIDGPNKYLKPISPDFNQFKMNLMSTDDQIIGVLVQARRNYEE